jgi:hypothetical protein
LEPLAFKAREDSVKWHLRGCPWSVKEAPLDGRIKLKNQDPNIWLTKFLGEAIKGRDFSKHSFKNLSFEFWRRYRPPVNMIRVTATKHVWSIVEGLRGDLRPNNITV